MDPQTKNKIYNAINSTEKGHIERFQEKLKESRALTPKQLG